MTLKDIVASIVENGALGLVLILSLVEVSKIKVNPWSALFSWIGDRLMAGMKKEVADIKAEVSIVKTEVAGVKTDIGALRDESRENEAKAARNRILRFGDEVYQGVHHSKEYFDHILADISNYKNYCKEHPEFQNEMTVLTVQHIESIYQRCLVEHDFL